MKKSQLLTIIIVTALLLISCGEKPPYQKNDMVFNNLNKSIESILSINSISYVSNYEQKLTTDDDTITTITTTEIKRIDEPFVIWNKVQNTVSHTNAQIDETITESYQERTKKDSRITSI